MSTDVLLKDIHTDQILNTFSGHTNTVNSAAFSNDGKKLVTGSEDNTARVWDVASGKLLMLLSGHTTQVKAVAFSPDGTKALTADVNDARLWSITTDNLQQTFSAPAGVGAFALAPDGKTILVSDVNGGIGLWDLNTRQS